MNPKLYYRLFLGVVLLLLFQAAMQWSTARAENIIDHSFEAEALLLAEPYSGNILFAQNENKRIYPASLTKMMTVLLAMEELHIGTLSLKEKVTVSDSASSMGGSQLFLSEGDRVTVEELLIGVVVGSANDAAVALAEHIAGAEGAFVEKMNERAQELGMDHTNFVNPSGQHDENHYTTALDLLYLSKAVLEYPQYHEWATIWMDEHFLKDKIKSGEVFLSNTNRLIIDYDSCDGLKSGYTDEGGHCLAATAKKNGTRFIALVFGAPTSQALYNESIFLLDYGFHNYKNINVLQEKTLIEKIYIEKGVQARLPAAAEESFNLLVDKGYEPQLNVNITYDHPIAAPISEGDILGSIEVWDGNKIKGAVNLIALESVPKASYFELLRRYFIKWLAFGR